MCSKLIIKATENGSQDNISILVIKFWSYLSLFKIQVMLMMIYISFNLLMLLNRLQSTSSLLFNNTFNFAKNLKQIGMRMKAVSSIKKITKVTFNICRQWRWSQHLKWSKISADFKGPKHLEFRLFKGLWIVKLTLLKRRWILRQRNFY